MAYILRDFLPMEHVLRYVYLKLKIYMERKKPMKILIVDDETEIADLIEVYLKNEDRICQCHVLEYFLSIR